MRTDSRFVSAVITAIVFLSTLGPALSAKAGPEVELSRGGTVYVSIYSNVFAGPRKVPFQLSAMVVIRNTDPSNSLRVLAADYYDTNGKKVRGYVDRPLEVTPLATVHYYIEEYDKSGGAGANFIVRWEAAREINIPIIEGVMTGGGSGQGISFRSPGQYITDQGN